MDTQSLRKQFLGKKWFSLPVAILLILVSFSGTTAFSQASDDDPVAEMVITTTRIRWRPLVEHDGIVLTVTGSAGVVHQVEFAPGKVPRFGLVSSEGKRYPDGIYTYELVAKPVLDEKERSALEEARASGESIEMPRQVQSGHFAILDGAFVTSTVPESLEEAPAAPQDIVHNDDVIIDGSLCVGNDCYSGLAFGFDTIVLMENNLRIFFDDTSTIQNYPRNDWRIIINDSTDGGGRYFAIEDATEVSNILVLEAGAPDNSLYVDSHGDVGINTSTPYYELHIVDGDSPAIRLDQDGSYGWEPQKWDLCGNESNFFIRDATHASKLPFRIEPDAPTDSIFIKSDGKVGIGTGTPAQALEVERTGTNAVLLLDRVGGARFKMTAGLDRVMFGSETNHGLQLLVNNTPQAELNSSGDLTIAGELTASSCNCSSDVNAKENFDSVDGKEVLAQLGNVEITTWNFKTDADSVRHMGPTAQDFYAAYGLGADDTHINTVDAAGVALVAIKELNAQNEALQAENAALRGSVSDLEARMAALEAKGGGDVAPAARPLQDNILLITGLLLTGVSLGLGLSLCLIRMARRDSDLSLLKIW